jgi:hypothetical protein
MIPADKNDGGRLPARRRCGRNLVASGEGMRPFLFAGARGPPGPGQSSKTLMDTLDRAGRTATFPGNVLSLKARSVRDFTL